MKSIHDHLFIEYKELHKGVYLAKPENFWTFLSAGSVKEDGICDWWYDVAEVYPEDTIIFYPIELDKEMIYMCKDTIYRGVKDLDEDPGILCYYRVVDTTRLAESLSPGKS